MKKIENLTLLLCLCLVACKSTPSQIEGVWKEVLSPYKSSQISAILKANEAEIQAMTKVPADLASQYGTDDLELLKVKMLEDERRQYEPQNFKSYKFTNDGYLLICNDKNGAEDTLFSYEITDTDLNLTLLDEEKAFSESIFEEGSTMNILRNTKDSLVLTMTAGTFVDTIYMQKSKH